MVFPEMFGLLKSYVPEDIEWGKYGVPDKLLALLNRADEGRIADDELRKELRKVVGAKMDGQSAISQLEKYKKQLTGKEYLAVSVFGALTGRPEKEAKQHLLDAYWVKTMDVDKARNDQTTVNEQFVRACALHSSGFLGALVFTGKNELERFTKGLAIVELAKAIEKDYDLFSTAANRIIEGPQDYREPNIFKTVTESCMNYLDINEQDELIKFFGHLNSDVTFKEMLDQLTAPFE
jgi:hypothetical protein